MKYTIKIYSILAIALSLFWPLVAQPANPVIDSLIHLITYDSYVAHFDSLKTNKGHFRKVTEAEIQSVDHDACRDYIFRSMQRVLGAENVSLHKFETGNYNGLANVIGIKKGSKPNGGFIIISAHYDSNNSNETQLTNCAPGANDNGTGLASLLEIARVLSGIETECSVIFAAWDFEEQMMYGFPVGSNHWFSSFVRNSKKKKADEIFPINRKEIIANINFDMIGNPMETLDGKPVLWACLGNRSHKKFIDSYITIFNEYAQGICAINGGMVPYSDHYTFAARRIPAVENLESGFSDDPYYHTCNDNIENEKNINFSFATEVTRGGLAYILSLCLLKND